MTWTSLPRSRRRAFLPRPSPRSVHPAFAATGSGGTPSVLPAPPPADPPPAPAPPAPPEHNYEYYNPNDYNDWWYNMGADGGGGGGGGGG